MEINNPVLLQRKSTYSPYVSQILTGGGYAGNYILTPQIAYWLFEKSDAVSNAVRKIAWAFEQMDPILVDDKNQQITEHPFLKLLKKPGKYQSGHSFMFELMVAYLLTGECYPVALGNVSFEPISLYTVKPNKTSLVEGGDGWLHDIITSAHYDNNNYTRQDLPKRDLMVYQSKDKLAETMQIYIQRRKEGLRAQSVLDSIYYQACTKFFGNQHNSSIVKNASRIGGLWSPDGKTSMSQTQYESFKNEVDQNFSGPSNAGRNVVSPVPVKYENFLLNTRDMDFANLLDKYRNDIYSQYDIPLPLVIPDAMTFNNYGTGIEAFYDMAVLPRAKFLFSMLGLFLLSRYKNSENLTLTVNEKQLSALKSRLFKRAKEMGEAAVFSDNEIRNESGYESMGPEGNQIYKPSTLVPSGQDDDYTDDLIVRDD